jgi:predicted outer membrane repeat protein
LGEVSQINGNGGAITFKDSSSNSIFTCDFVNNFAARTGGGVNYRQTPYNITFNSNFINNSAETGGGVNFFESLENVVFNGQFIGNNASYGGAIALKNGDIKNTSFRNNRAETGGAIYFDNNGTVVNCEFNDNAISDDYGNGGAIYFRNSGIITDCNFTNNKAIYYAGAVYFGSDAIIHNSNFNGNDAQNGGSVYILGSGEVNNCNFTNNTARTGGAIEFWGNGTVNNSNFNDNVASFSGGAIYSSKNLVINDCTFNNNSAEGYAGGAVNIFAKGEINHCVFNGNRASFKGGAIFFNGDGIVMNTTITNTNTEEGSIYFRKNGIINESDFINNTAKDGGAILSYGNLTIDNSRLENNLATLGTNHISLKNDATIKLINMNPKDFEPFYIGYLNIINSVDVTYGENVIISVNVSDQNHIPFNNGTISVIIDNDVYTANVENGSANVTIPKPNAGNYDVNVTYTGNEYVAISQVKFNVSKQNAVISAASKSYVINYGGKYSIVLKSVKGNVIASKKVTFKLNGKNLGSIVTNSKGVATISLTSKILKTAKAGKKNLVIQFTDSNYNSASKTVKITINKEKTKLIAKNKGFKKSNKIKKYAISLKNSKGKVIKKASVALKVKGKIYKAKTNSKGKAIFKITKLNKKGKFSAVIKFSANKYYAAASKKVKITIK